MYGVDADLGNWNCPFGQHEPADRCENRQRKTWNRIHLLGPMISGTFTAQASRDYSSTQHSQASTFNTRALSALVDESTKPSS
jgi:hypothetical protein